jgi:hypothetical protein
VRKVGLAQLVKFLVIKLIHSGLNLRFNIGVIFTANYFFSERRCLIDSETLLMTDFVNLKIKPTQYFRCAHRSMMYIHIFIGVSVHTCINIYVYTVFLR